MPLADILSAHLANEHRSRLLADADASRRTTGRRAPHLTRFPLGRRRAQVL